MIMDLACPINTFSDINQISPEKPLTFVQISLQFEYSEWYLSSLNEVSIDFFCELAFRMIFLI